MEDLISLGFAIGLFIILFIYDYFFNKRRKLKNRKKKKNNITELDYLKAKFHLKLSKLDKNKIIIVIALINSFIISFVSYIIMILELKIIWLLIIAFALLFSLIYSLYEIYGRYLKRKEDKYEHTRN